MTRPLRGLSYLVASDLGTFPRTAFAAHRDRNSADMQVLWAPWRMAYIGGPKQTECIFCTHPEAPDLRPGLVLARTADAVVMLNRFPYMSGHVMVAPRRHTADLGVLPAAEYGNLGEILRRSVAIVQETFQAEGMNVGLNLGRAAGAGITEHFHWHVVPRWVGDTNFMPLIGEVRVMPEHLEVVYDRLRPAFARLEA